MPRKPNYQFEKRQKELDRKSRQEEKLRRRQERTADNNPDATDGERAPDAGGERDDAPKGPGSDG